MIRSPGFAMELLPALKQIIGIVFDQPLDVA